MAHRIEIEYTTLDTRKETKEKEINFIGFSGKIDSVKLVDVYTIEENFERAELEMIQSMLVNPVFQPAMMMLKSDLYGILSSSLEGKLNQVKMEFNRGASCCIVLASRGYPNEYKKGLEITGLEDAEKINGVKVFHAGTKKENGRVLTSGGRVLGVTPYPQNGIEEAQALSYEAASRINIPGGFHYRKDIASKALRKKELKF